MVVWGPYPWPLWPGRGIFTYHIAAPSFTLQRWCTIVSTKGTAPIPADVLHAILCGLSPVHLDRVATLRLV